MLDSGNQTTHSGMGESYENFVNTGQLTGFTGCGSAPATKADDHFEDAPIRTMTFAETFGDMDYNCKNRMHIN